MSVFLRNRGGLVNAPSRQDQLDASLAAPHIQAATAASAARKTDFSPKQCLRHNSQVLTVDSIASPCKYTMSLDLAYNVESALSFKNLRIIWRILIHSESSEKQKNSNQSKPPYHKRELPRGHCFTGSTLLGFNTTQTQHFLCLTFNTPHIKQSRIQQ